MQNLQRSTRRRAVWMVALLVVLAVIAAACGGSDSNSGSSGGSNNNSGNEGKPQSGGTIVYALEGKTTELCPPKTQAAISGIMLTQAIYDTLTEPDANGDYQPYLAKSVTPNSTYDEWTITLRDGVKFHDGTPVDAAAVAQNIEAWRKGILLQFVFADVASVDVTGPMTVVVKTKVPWVAFPAYLWSTGRVGIAAPAQLDSPDCATKLIGSGPFKLKSFDPSTGDLSVVKNDGYWRKGFPYLDGIDFKVQGDATQRINGLQGGQFDVLHTSGGKDLKAVQAFNAKTWNEPEGFREISETLLNVQRPPLNDLRIRQALAQGLDRKAFDAIENGSTGHLANQVVDSKVLGYLQDPGFPKYNVSAAKNLVNQWKSDNGGKTPTFNLQSTFDQTTQALAAEFKRQAAKIGITVNLPAPVDQAAIINQAIGGNVDSFLWRNYPGSDPDTLYVWFHSGSPVNFNKIDDPVVDQNLEAGRSETNPDTRKQQYETFNKQLSTQVYSLYSWYTDWFIAAKQNVNGILGPNLPDENGDVGTKKPADVLAGYHQLLGIWVSK